MCVVASVWGAALGGRYRFSSWSGTEAALHLYHAHGVYLPTRLDSAQLLAGLVKALGRPTSRL